jgi:hypothetical protein
MLALLDAMHGGEQCLPRRMPQPRRARALQQAEEAMTTKRTHGPCTCAFATVFAVAPGAAMTGMEHAPDCPSLYPAQQEPDALTRLAKQIHALNELIGSGGVDVLLSIISEAREEQRRAVVHAENNGLERARKMASFEGFDNLASLFEAAKKVTP